MMKIKASTVLSGLSVLLSVATAIVSNIQLEKEVEEACEEKYGLKPIEKESD